MAYLRVNIIEPSSPPSNGYVFKYRLVGSTTWTSVTNIASVGAGETIEGSVDSIASGNYEVLIQSDCGSGVYGTAVVTAATAKACVSHSVQNVSGTTTYTYTYLRCNDGQTVTVYLPASTTSATFCSITGSLTVSNANLVVSAAGICVDPETGA